MEDKHGFVSGKNYKILPPKGDRKLIKAWINHVGIEDSAVAQLLNVASMPIIFKHVAVMPDVHTGYGATVGTVIATEEAVIPAAVGVDIGCGMCATRTDLYKEDLGDLRTLRLSLERAVPTGGPGERGSWKEDRIPKEAWEWWGRDCNGDEYDALCDIFPTIKSKFAERQLGTLGTGNHFIELCLDEDDSVWIMLHSGSRGMGNRIGTEFTKIAKAEMKRWHIKLPDDNLAYLPAGTKQYEYYMRAVELAQSYAKTNRRIMETLIIRDLMRTISKDSLSLSNEVDCHHNYVDLEHHYGKNVLVTRKGAVRARKGDMGIIPGSMGEKSFIVKGLGNPESFHSCSHGAGRLMSRTAAKKQFSLEDHKKAVEGVECRIDASVIDETPGSYKDLDAVMASQVDLVEPVHTLKQILCVKG